MGVWYKYASCGDVTTFLLHLSTSFSLLFFFRAALSLFCDISAIVSWLPSSQAVSLSAFWIYIELDLRCQPPNSSSGT